MGWLDLGQNRPSSPFSKGGFLSSFEPSEIPFTFPCYISHKSLPFGKLLQKGLLGPLPCKQVLDLNPLGSTYSSALDLPLYMGLGGQGL